MKNDVDKQYGYLYHPINGMMKKITFNDLSKRHHYQEFDRGFILLDYSLMPAEYCNNKTTNFPNGFLKEIREGSPNYSTKYKKTIITKIHKMAEFAVYLLDFVHFKIYGVEFKAIIENYETIIPSADYNGFIPDGRAKIVISNSCVISKMEERKKANENPYTIFDEIIFEFCMFHKCSKEKRKYFKQLDRVFSLQIYLNSLFPDEYQMKKFGFDKGFLYNFINALTSGKNQTESFSYLGKFTDFKNLFWKIDTEFIYNNLYSIICDEAIDLVITAAEIENHNEAVKYFEEELSKIYVYKKEIELGIMMK